MLESKPTRKIFDQIKDNSSSLMVLRDSASYSSFLTQDTGVSSKFSAHFDFDSDLLNSRVYQVAVRTILGRRKGMSTSASIAARPTSAGYPRDVCSSARSASPETVIEVETRESDSANSEAPTTPLAELATFQLPAISATLPFFDFPSFSTRVLLKEARLPLTISWSPKVQFHEVDSEKDYDRRGPIATCNRLTPMLAQQIKVELNSYKMVSLLKTLIQGDELISPVGNGSPRRLEAIYTLFLGHSRACNIALVLIPTLSVLRLP
jgi:hypothetical protein